jgi:hypothetical protein
MNVIYYYCYLYCNFFGEEWPHEISVFTLSFGEGFFLNVIVEALLMICFKISLGINSLLCIAIIIWGINYFYFNKSGRAGRIVRDKPKFLGSHRLSQIITAVFFVVTYSSLFWGPVLTRYLKDIYCK